MANIVANTRFNGQTVGNAATLEVIDQVEITPRWYTDYPTRTLVNDGASDQVSIFDQPSKALYGGDWSTGPYLLTGLDYILDVYIAGAGAGVSVNLSTRSIDVPNISNPTIISLDGNVTQSNGICRFKIRFENPLATAAFGPIADRYPEYRENLFNYFVTFNVTTAFGTRIHRALVFNSGLGQQEPTIVTTADKRPNVWNRDGYLFLPVNRSITMLFVGGGGSGGGSAGGLFTTDGQDGADAAMHLIGSHSWLRWYLTNTYVNNGDLRIASNLFFSAKGGRAGRSDSNINHTRTDLGGSGGQADFRLLPYGGPNARRLAQGKTRFPSVRLDLTVDLLGDGFAGSSSTTNVNGGTGIYFNDQTNDPEEWGFGGRGGRRLDVDSAVSGYGGGGGSGARIKVTLTYVNDATADKQYVPPLVLKPFRSIHLAPTEGGKGLHRGRNGAKGGIVVTNYQSV